MPEDAQIAADPANEVCPDFTSAIYALVRLEGDVMPPSSKCELRSTTPVWKCGPSSRLRMIAQPERREIGDRNAKKRTTDLRVKRTSWSNGGRQEYSFDR